MIAFSSRATRLPDSDVSATRPRHSRLKSSTTTRMRNRRRSVSVSEAKSSDQRWFGPCGSVIGARVPRARFRPPRRRTCSRSSAYSRRSFLWFIRIPSRANSNFNRRQLRYAVLAAYLRHVHPGFLLAQNADDLLLGEPASLHSSASPSGSRTLPQLGGFFRAQVS